MIDIQGFVHQASLSYLAGRILTIFFKKKFSFKAHFRQVLFDSFAVFIASLIAPWLGSLGTILETFAFVYSNARHLQDEMVKTAALSTSLYFAAYADWTENTFDELTLMFATTQFLRKPDKIKEYLREPRIVCGPIYVIMMSAGIRVCSFGDLNVNMRSVATIVSVLCSVVAAVFFRPDNNQTLKVFLPASRIPTTSHRQVTHGLLMFSSLVVTCLKLLKTAPSLMLSASIFGPLNILLFVTYKISKQQR